MAPDPRPVNAPLPTRPTRAARPHSHLPAAVLALALLALGGCALFEAPAVPRGNRVDPETLSQITPGVQTRADIQALLGTPSARGTFDDNHWYYISATTRLQPGRPLRVNDQRVVSIAFDERGVVREIRELDEDDGRRIDMVSRETPVPGNDRTILQQLLGNIGRVGGPPGGNSATMPGSIPGGAGRF